MTNEALSDDSHATSSATEVRHQLDPLPAQGHCVCVHPVARIEDRAHRPANKAIALVPDGPVHSALAREPAVDR